MNSNHYRSQPSSDLLPSSLSGRLSFDLVTSWWHTFGLVNIYFRVYAMLECHIILFRYLIWLLAPFPEVKLFLLRWRNHKRSTRLSKYSRLCHRERRGNRVSQIIVHSGLQNYHTNLMRISFWITGPQNTYTPKFTELTFNLFQHSRVPRKSTQM